MHARDSWRWPELPAQSLLGLSRYFKKEHTLYMFFLRVTLRGVRSAVFEFLIKSDLKISRQTFS